MSSELMFTIGCLHFGVRAAPRSTFVGRRYVDEIQTLFERSSSVAEVRMSVAPEFEEETLEVPSVPAERDEWNQGKGRTLIESEDVFPSPWGLRLDVTLRIPRRVQKEALSEDLRNWVGYPSEEYRLVVDYSHGLPVAAVLPAGSTGLSEGQDAMVIVREFIAGKLAEPEGFLFVDVVGPTPFHADFFVRPATGGMSRPLAYSVVSHSRGPDEVIFEYDTTVYGSAEEAFPEVMSSIQAEAEFFYRTVRGLEFDMLEWARIDSTVESLIEQHREHGTRATIKRLRRGSGALTDVIIDLSRFERRQLFERQGVESRYDTYFPSSQQQYLRTFLDYQLRQQQPYPVAQTTDLVRSFERWRTHTVNSLGLVASALGGAAVGAVIAALLS